MAKSMYASEAPRKDKDFVSSPSAVTLPTVSPSKNSSTGGPEILQNTVHPIRATDVSEKECEPYHASNVAEVSVISSVTLPTDIRSENYDYVKRDNQGGRPIALVGQFERTHVEDTRDNFENRAESTVGTTNNPEIMAEAFCVYTDTKEKKKFHKKRNLIIIIVVLILIILIALTVAVTLYIGNRENQVQNKIESTPTTQSEKQTSPTVTPTVKPTVTPTKQPTESPIEPEWQIIQTIYGNEADSSYGSSVHFSQDGSMLFVGSSNSCSMYLLDGLEIKPHGEDIIGGVNSVVSSNDGTYVAIANERYNEYQGRVRVFTKKDDGTTELMGSPLFGDEKKDLFGKVVTMSDDGYQLAIGTSGIQGSDGSYVRAYKWNGNDWVQQGDDLTGPNGSYFGYSVSMTSNGNIIAIGAVLSQYVEVYEWKDAGWKIRGKRLETIASISGATWFGNWVDISSDGNVLVVGAPFELNRKGKVYSYGWNGSEYTLRDIISGLEDKNEFGWSLSISGNGLVLAVGTWNDKSNTQVFEWNESSAIWQQRLPSLDGGEWTRPDLSYDGSTLVIGLPENSDQAPESGKLTVYKWLQ